MRSPNWERIRAHYRHNEMAIHQAGASEWGIDPYAWDHDAGIQMTPIEAWLWSDIRAVGAVLWLEFGDLAAGKRCGYEPPASARVSPTEKAAA